MPSSEVRNSRSQIRFERCGKGLMSAQKVEERENLADVVTKFLDATRFRTCFQGIGLIGNN